MTTISYIPNIVDSVPGFYGTQVLKPNLKVHNTVYEIDFVYYWINNIDLNNIL